MKTCTKCGRFYFWAPRKAKVLDAGDEFDGTYWNCSCGTTIFRPKHYFLKLVARWVPWVVMLTGLPHFHF